MTHGQRDEFKDVKSSSANDPIPVVDDPGVPSEEDGQLLAADDLDVLDREDNQRQAADDQEPMIAVDRQSRSTPSTVQQSSRRGRGRPPKRGAIPWLVARGKRDAPDVAPDDAPDVDESNTPDVVTHRRSTRERHQRLVYDPASGTSTTPSG